MYRAKGTGGDKLSVVKGGVGGWIVRATLYLPLGGEEKRVDIQNGTDRNAS
ncbi:hypothetical protein [Caballeronia grimmiae]|uniref:Uncharacterized protein n=1 Tax=Caballeronia grimmiae TaxID=1071679 RepID=A0ABQ1RM23_9BURK|nr:hypothetical protein [Caballeronia grimmiae]GGD74491.1 hypothetical protein GCM10010985_31190 [Caballeronia grimmiae]